MQGETPTCDNGSMALLEAGAGTGGRVVARAALELLEPTPVPVPVLESFGASSAFFPSLALFLVESSSFSLYAVVPAEVLLRENLDSEGVRLVLEPVIATAGVAGGRFGGLAATETAPLAKAIAKTAYSSGIRSLHVRQCLIPSANMQPPKRTGWGEGRGSKSRSKQGKKTCLDDATVSHNKLPFGDTSPLAGSSTNGHPIASVTRGI